MDFRFLLLAVALCVILIFAFVFIQNQLRAAHVRMKLKNLTDKEKTSFEIFITKFSKVLAGQDNYQKSERMMRNAGFFEVWQLDVFLAIKFLFLFVVILFAWFAFELSFSTLFSDYTNSFKYLFTLFIAYRLPDWILGDLVKRRQEKIRNAVPKAIDLMTICVDSGLSLEDSFERVAREVIHQCPEIAMEFTATRSEMLVMDRTEALKRMETRSGVREIEILATSLLQSIRYGTALAESLRLISKEGRAKQVAYLEEKAGNISATIGIPLIILVLFPLVGIIIAPAIIALKNTF